MPKKKKDEHKARQAYIQPALDIRTLPVRICEHIAEKGIYAILLLVPVTFLSNAYWPFDIPKVTLLRILTLIVLGGYLGKIIASREWKIVKPPALLWLPILIYAAIYAISTIFSMSPDLSLQSGEGRNLGLVSLAGMILLYFMVMNIMTERRQLIRCLNFFLISSSVVAVLGILQDYGKSPIEIMSNAMGNRASATFGNPDFLFAMMILAVPVSYGALIKEKRLIYQLIYFTSSVILGWCILLSMPHLFGDDISLLVAFLIPAGILAVMYISRVLKGRQNRIIGYSSLVTLAVLALCLLIIFNAGGIQDNFSGWEKRFRGEDTDRYMLAGIALDSVGDHPIIGSGPNTFRNTFPQYATLKYAQHDPERREDKVHNSYIEALSTTGWLGLLTYVSMQIALFGYLLMWLWRNRKKPASVFVFWILVAGIVYMAHTLAMFHTTTPYTFFWILMATGVSFTMLDRPRIKTLRFNISQILSNALLFILGVLICLSIFIAVRPLVANAYYFQGEMRFSTDPRNNSPAYMAPHAIPFYEKAVQWNGSEVRYRWAYALTLLAETGMMDQDAKEKQCAKIRNVINEAIEKEPESGMLYYNRGILMYQCGAGIDEIMEDINKSVEMYPTGWMLRQFRAQINTQLGNLEQAIEDDEIALAVKPGNYQWMMRLGNNYLTLGDQYDADDNPETNADELYEKAVYIFNEATEKKPSDATSQYFLAVAYDKTGQIEEATSEYEQAITMLTQFLESDSENVYGHYMLGFCYERTGNIDKAEQEYYTVLDLQPNHQQAKDALTRISEGGN